MKKNINEKGFMALTSILIVSAITLAVAVSISLLGVGEARSSLDFKRGVETLDIAEACVEEALFRLKDSESYSGGLLNVGNGQCSISVSGTSEDKTIDIVAQISQAVSYSKKIQVTAKRKGSSINITDWNEIP